MKLKSAEQWKSEYGLTLREVSEETIKSIQADVLRHAADIAAKSDFTIHARDLLLNEADKLTK